MNDEYVIMNMIMNVCVFQVPRGVFWHRGLAQGFQAGGEQNLQIPIVRLERGRPRSFFNHLRV